MSAVGCLVSGRRHMKRRILALLDKQWGEEKTPPIDRFEGVRLLRVFAVEEIAEGRHQQG